MVALLPGENRLLWGQAAPCHVPTDSPLSPPPCFLPVGYREGSSHCHLVVLTEQDVLTGGEASW